MAQWLAKVPKEPISRQVSMFLFMDNRSCSSYNAIYNFKVLLREILVILSFLLATQLVCIIITTPTKRNFKAEGLTPDPVTPLWA